MISKFLVGQEVSGYTKKDKVFEGFVKKHPDGRKVVLNENGKWMYLAELKKIKQVGRRLNEEYEEAINNITSTLSPDKLANKESDFENIAKDIATAAGLSDSDPNRSDAEKFAHQKLVGLKSQKDASTSGNEEAMKKAQDNLKDIEKDPDEQVEDSLKESEEKSVYDNNKKLFKEYKRKKAMRETYNEFEDFDYAEDPFEYEDDVSDSVTFDNDDFEDGLSDEAGMPQDTDTGSVEFDDVDDEFEAELDAYEASGGDYSDEYLLEALAKKFGGDAQLALKESNGNKMDAVVNLANQVKALREIKTSNDKFMLGFGDRLADCIDHGNVDRQFLNYLQNVVGRTAASEEGIVSSNPEIAPVGKRLETPEEISRLVYAACCHTGYPVRQAIDFCKRHKKDIGEALYAGIRAGNECAALGKYSLGEYQTALATSI